MHTVLDLQTDWPDSQNYQTLKQGLGQTCFGCLLTHHHRAQLAVITHQNQLQKKQQMIKEEKLEEKKNCGHCAPHSWVMTAV